MTSSDAYKAIHEGAVVGAIDERRQIALTGADRATYLHGLLTNDIATLAPGTGCYTLWLTPQGRTFADMHVLQSDEMLLLDVPASLTQAIVEKLDQFIFTEDVQVASLDGSLTSVWVHGPQAAAVLERVLDGAAGAGEWAAYQHARVSFGGSPVSLARIDQLGVHGYCVHVEPAREGELRDRLEAEGAVTAPVEAIEAARIEAVYPVFGLDFTDETIPLEAGVEDRGISFTKGCYVGQEVIIRVLHRGKGRIAKKLVLLRVDGAVPPAGAKLMSGDREVGVVTSAAESPAAGSVALGYLHRDFLEPGTAVEVLGTAGRSPARVTLRPIPSAV
jgi:folate-binding protein YgfZ